MSIFGPRVDSTGTLPSKLDKNFLVKIKVLRVSGLNLSVFFLSSYKKNLPAFDGVLGRIMPNYNQFKDFPLASKIESLNSNNASFKNLDSIGYSSQNKKKALILEKLYSKLKEFKIGICLFDMESYDSSIKVLKFCKNDSEISLFFFCIFNKLSNLEELYLLIPRYPNIPLNLIENRIYRSHRFTHNCGQSMLRCQLLWENPNCIKCTADLTDFKEFYTGACEHGNGLKLKCCHGYCFECMRAYNKHCKLCGYGLDASDIALILASIFANEGNCNRCINLNYLSSIDQSSCIDCVYEDAYNGRISLN